MRWLPDLRHATREVAVENFRPFQAASIRLPASGLVLVAGANNSGKSALLSALDVVAGIGADTQAPALEASWLPHLPSKRSVLMEPWLRLARRTCREASSARSEEHTS